MGWDSDFTKLLDEISARPSCAQTIVFTSILKSDINTRMHIRAHAHMHTHRSTKAAILFLLRGIIKMATCPQYYVCSAAVV